METGVVIGRDAARGSCAQLDETEIPVKSEETYLTLRTKFYRWLDEGGPHEQALDALLSATRSRAIGLWQQASGRLSLLGFRGVPEMGDDVKNEFVSATTDVSLTRAGLAIVSAAVTGEPFSGSLDEDAVDVDSSSNWLARFGAIQSLAVPIQAAGENHGVLAVSTANRIEKGDPVWTLMTRLATSLAPLLQERAGSISASRDIRAGPTPPESSSPGGDARASGIPAEDSAPPRPPSE